MERSWVKDEWTLKVHCWMQLMINMYIFGDYIYLSLVSSVQSGFQRLEDIPMPFWLALFVEGMRFMQTKLAAAQEYAASRGMPVPGNVLIPWTKVSIFLNSNKFNLYGIYIYIYINISFFVIFSLIDDSLSVSRNFCVSLIGNAKKILFVNY